MRNTTPLDYQELRNISPKAARQAILQILKSNNGKISETARMLGVTRKTVYKALAKRECGNLDDSSRSPKVVHNKTPNEIEEKVILLKRKTHYGPIRLKEELEAVYALQISAHTIRNIVRRNREKIKGKTHKPHKKGPRPFVDWYTARPFEVVQIDLKHVIDQKALTMAQIDHIHAHKLPIYQWSAIDVNSRFKLIAYSDEKSWTNGLTWFLWVTSWLRSHGVTHQIVYTVDHGEEFGGKSWYKITELRKLLSGFGCKLIQNHLKHPEENAHLERSHRTDDDEFYIPRILKINSRQEMFTEAFNYMFYYNAVRKHSGINRETPVQRLFRLEPHLDDRIKFVPPLILDNISINLGPWSGYHVLAQHQIEGFGGIRFGPKIANQMKHNYDVLFSGNWSTMDEFGNHLEEQRKSDPSPDHYMLERKAALYIQKTFSGFGPKQSRNFWQSLGLTRYEFVLDSRVLKWLRTIGFPLPLSSMALGEEEYYCFISDILRDWCIQTGVLPCILDAAIFSSYDTDEWPEDASVW